MKSTMHYKIKNGLCGIGHEQGELNAMNEQV